MGGACSTYGEREREREEVYTRFWWGNLRKSDHLEDPGVDGTIISRWISGSGMGTGLIWLRIGTGGGLL